MSDQGEKLHQLILENMDVIEFWESVFQGLTYESDGWSEKISCPFHTEDTPSFNLNSDGRSKCFGCNAGFTDPIWFYAKYYSVTLEKARRTLFEEWVQILVPDSHIVKCNLVLTKRSSKTKNYLFKKYGITLDDIKEYMLGVDLDDRTGFNKLIIPVPGEHLGFTDARRIRYKRGDDTEKNLAYKKGYASGGALFPYCALEEDTLYLTEGHFDTICLRRQGFNAMTAGGSSSLTKDLVPYFEGKIVFVVFDNDESGIKGARRVRKMLKGVAKAVVNITLPGDGTDVCDYFVKDKQTPEDFEILVEKFYGHVAKDAELKLEMELGEAAEEVRNENTYHHTTLEKIFKRVNHDREVSLDVFISGSDDSMHTGLKQITLTCKMNRDKACNNCHMNASGGCRPFKFESTDEINLLIEGQNDSKLHSYLKKRFDIPMPCGIVVDRFTTVTVQRVVMVPKTGKRSGRGVSYRKVIGHTTVPLETNNFYRVYGKVLTHPNNQEMSFIIDKAEKQSADYANYKPNNSERAKELNHLFNPEGLDADNIEAKLNEHVDFFSRNITHIHGRPEAILPILLTYFSPLEMEFEGELFYSYLNTILIGDTNTGKNRVLDRMRDFFDKGIIASGQSVSEAGLIGGLFNHIFSLGLIPTNDGGLVAIDEGSQIKEIFSKLKNVREGKADYFKGGIQCQTVARTRMIVLANAPKRFLGKYGHGIVSLLELFNDPADLSRFTMASFLAEGHEKYDVLNKAKPQPVETDITMEDWQEHLTRAWWQPLDKIVVPQATVDECYTQAKLLSKKYHPSIPLIQKTTVRFRLIAVAAAISSLMSFVKKSRLIIPPQAVVVASRFLQGLYNMPACAYDRYSSSERAKGKVSDKEEVIRKIFQREKQKGNLKFAIDALLDLKELTMDDFHKVFTYLEGDSVAATNCFRTLYRNNCLERKGQSKFYQPTQAFISLLLNMRSKFDNGKKFEGGLFN